MELQLTGGIVTYQRACHSCMLRQLFRRIASKSYTSIQIETEPLHRQVGRYVVLRLEAAEKATVIKC